MRSIEERHKQDEEVALRAEDLKLVKPLVGTLKDEMELEVALQQIIYNLCDNGIKYNKAGGHVNVTVGSRQGCPFVSVEDNGIGIPEEDQKRVVQNSGY